MRIQSNALPLFLSALLPSLATAVTFDCAHINTDGYLYDLSALGGVHQLNHIVLNATQGYTQNTTYVLNICQTLGKAANRPEGKCGLSKNVCGFIHDIPADGNGDISWGFPIAGLDPMGHGSKDPEFTRLQKLDENTQGLRVKLSGGNYRSTFDGPDHPTAAVIDFQCDPDRSGLEGVSTSEDEEVEEKKLVRREKEKKPSSLQFKSFGVEDDDIYVLRLDWQTRYACDDYQRGKQDSSSHWGIFTWLIIILFLAVAAYLIFGSWLNYSRYGARGWDLLPHGDAIREIPYMLRDWFRRVVNTFQGSSSRGGYSAV
ncbi:hypothetical protein N7495_002083 [Penicillium taxi]|uniref:uncharacterized protein n=1 Tax=Penicillium taxi TaxID=168475 RepID=UPI002545383A|nr:uncharacterized protein N7495_002083 [Penicillium taxi]KAJ5901555.1 hypothetical protein N7495_002083 [Penicillium taxi]